MEQTALVVTFVQGRAVDPTIENILEGFTLINGKIFLLQDVEDEKRYILTYNIKKESSRFSDVIPNTIFLHRKKDSNTLYTLNALNEIVKLQNQGVLDSGFTVDWSNYHNSILLTRRPEDGGEETLRQIHTKLLKIINVDNQ